MEFENGRSGRFDTYFKENHSKCWCLYHILHDFLFALQTPNESSSRSKTIYLAIYSKTFLKQYFCALS